MFFQQFASNPTRLGCSFLLATVMLRLSPGWAQDKQEQLDELRKNINALEKRVTEFRKDETSTLENLRILDEQTDLTRRLAGRLRKKEREKKIEVDFTASRLREGEQELDRLKAVGARRAVFFYKYGRIPDLEMLFSARSINQVLLWAEYQRRMADNDRRLLLGIQSKQEALQRQNQELLSELQSHKHLLAEKQKEDRALQDRKSQRESYLKKVRKDKAFYEALLAEERQAAERIARLINEDATAKENSLINVTAYDGSFASLKGQLPWPVDGTILTHYGAHRHPVLKTVTNNLGIDIASPEGAGVRTVANGQIMTITWQRGYGNLVMVSHADGYYTVYTNLSDILVSPGEQVYAGQVIGAVADRGPAQPAGMHFQVWQRTQDRRSRDLNPEEWLR